MKVIALLPVRNEAWVLAHTLDSLSRFCDVVIVSDQGSTDGSQEICARFSKVVLLDETRGADRLPQRARWRLLDAARGYDGHNLLWCTDADELVPPDLARTFLAAHAAHLVAPRAIACRDYHLWRGISRYRNDWSQYGPQWKVMAFADDRRVDYPRQPDIRPLHEPRTPVDDDPQVLKAEGLPMLHLQFSLWRRNQMKQAWYRCVEWIDGRRTAMDINGQYSITMPPWYVRTAPVPSAWLKELTLPSISVDAEPAWHDAEIAGLFDAHGIEFFEPMEIWHLPTLGAEFRRRVGRDPKPDRSYRGSWQARAASTGRLLLNAVRRRVLP